MAVDQYISDRQ